MIESIEPVNLQHLKALKGIEPVNLQHWKALKAVNLQNIPLSLVAPKGAGGYGNHFHW